MLALVFISVSEWLAIATFCVSTYTVVVQPLVRKPVVVAAKAVAKQAKQPVKLIRKIEGKSK